MSSSAALSPFQEMKKRMRDEAHTRRNAQVDKEPLSQTICEVFTGLPEYQAAKTVMFYVDVRSEVRTRHYLATACPLPRETISPP